MRTRMGLPFALACGLALVPSATRAMSTTVPLHWSLDEVKLAPAEDGRVGVRLPGGATLSQPGAPDLPWILVEVPVPPSDRVASWNWRPDGWAPLASRVVPFAGWLDRPSEAGGPVLADPDPAIYRGSAAYPAEPVQYRGLQAKAGQVAAIFLVCPFRWNPVDSSLSWSPGGTLEVRTDATGDASQFLPAPSRSLLEETPGAPLAKSLRPSGADQTGGAGVTLHTLKGGLHITQRPSMDSSPVEFLIVTDTTLVAEFQRLVDWKNRAGYPAAIRSVQWIEKNYTYGVDEPEKIRLFLKDAYLFWGTRTVILGGDPVLVPIRYAHTYVWGLPAGWDIASDNYYACLDGNWNADGDAIFGEALVPGYSPTSDEVDLRPELKVGRISARNAQQVRTYLDKYMSYSLTPNRQKPGYLDTILTLGEVLFDARWELGNPDLCQGGSRLPCVRADGAVDCFEMIDSVSTSAAGSFFKFDPLYEREYWWNDPQRRTRHDPQEPLARQLNPTNVKGSLNGGRNIVFHMGHGDRDRWAIGTGRLLASDVNQLTNAPNYVGLGFIVNCSSAAVDADCVGEAWQFAPNGGGLDYLGSTNLDFPVAARQMQNYFFHRWLADDWSTPGEVFSATCDSFGVRVGSSDNVFRFLLYSLILLGDPDMPVWKSIPGDLAVTAPSSFTLGGGPVQVTVRMGGNPLPSARVALYKADDALAVGMTDANGQVSLAFSPASAGGFQVTVLHPRALPYQGSGTVVAPSATSFVALSDYDVTDDGSAGSAGNGDHQIEIGETVALNLSYVNRSAIEAGNVTARLRLAGDPGELTVDIPDSVADLGTIQASGSGTKAAAFRFTVREPMGIQPEDGRERHVLPLRVIIEAGDGTHEQEIRPTVLHPRLLLIGNQLQEIQGNGNGQPELNEIFGVSFQVFNEGTGTASHLRGHLVNTYPNGSTVLDSMAVFPDVEAGQSQISSPFEVRVLQPANMRYTLVLEDTLGGSPTTIWQRRIHIERPLVPDSLRTSGAPSSIQLTWHPRSTYGNIWGYKIYRSTDTGGPFAPAGGGFVQAVRVFRDESLPALTQYFYKVAAVDSSGNESDPTSAVMGSTAPDFAPGWPAYLQDASSTNIAPTIENLNQWGKYEILMGSDVLYCYGADGSDYYDGDGNASTRGVLTRMEDGERFHGKRAVADLNGDGLMEIIGVATNKANQGPTPPALMVYDHFGHILWKVDLPAPGRAIVSSPAIGDIDGDGKDDIVFLGGTRVYAFHDDGTPVKAGSGGILLEMPSATDWQYGSVALANLDADPGLEIVFTTWPTDGSSAKLYVLNGDGTNAGPAGAFPFTYSSDGAGVQVSNSSVAIGDLTGDSTPESPKPDIVVATGSYLWLFDPWAPTQQGVRVRKMAILPRPSSDAVPSSVALGDIDGDGNLDVAVGGGSGTLYVMDREFRPLTGFGTLQHPYLQLSGVNSKMGSPIMADLDGDGNPEVAIGDTDGKVYVLMSDGSIMPGFPYTVVGGKIRAGLAAWDVDRDGFQNLIIQPEVIQQAVVLSLPNAHFDPTDERANPWPQFRHDARNTGRIDAPQITPVQLTGPTLSPVGERGVDLRWESSLSWSGFLLQRRSDTDGPWELRAQLRPEDVRVGEGRYHTVDEVPAGGTWHYRIGAQDWTGAVTFSLEETVVLAGAPVTFQLYPPQPNPMRPGTTIRLDLPGAAPVDVRILDVAGRNVRVLHSGTWDAGVHTLSWDQADGAGHRAGAGIYFVQATTPGQKRLVQRLVVLQ